MVLLDLRDASSRSARSRFATKQLNLGIDFESGTRIEAALAKPATVDQVRQALEDGGIDGAGDAKIQTATNPDFGDNVIQIQAQISPDQINKVQPLLDRSFGLENGNASFDSTSVGPTFGQEVAKKAVIAIIFSLLVISAYVAIRFEAKYAVPVMIALIHDILITGGVYALVGREVTSGTVAAFLTILGYSMYDTIIVFDRMRENVPRMPRAAFSQIVNRSMSEVLTRSLITGLSTVFLIGVLLVFGGATLQDFAFAMMVGVASGTYSSIFIAAPGAHRVEGARARLSIPPGADQGGDGIRVPRSRRTTWWPASTRWNATRPPRSARATGPGTRRVRRRSSPPRRRSRLPRLRGSSARRRRTGRNRSSATLRCSPPPRSPATGSPDGRKPARSAPSRRPGQEAIAPPAQAREEPLMAALVWFTTGVALWHFTVFLPDRFWGGIVGALLGAVAGALITGALGQLAHRRLDRPDRDRDGALRHPRHVARDRSDLFPWLAPGSRAARTRGLVRQG